MNLFGAAGSILGVLYQGYYSTLRTRARLPDLSFTAPEQYACGPRIFAICERDALAVAGVFRRMGCHALVALGRDGDLAGAALEKIGCRVFRGATRRGGVSATRALIRSLARFAGPAGLVVDGPLGPSGQARPGVLYCAARTGRPVVPLGIAASREVVFAGTWSRLFLPLPFSRVMIVCGQPIRVPSSAGRRELGPLAEELSRRLAEARESALQLARNGNSPAGRAALA